MLLSLRIVDLIYLDYIINNQTGLTIDQLNARTGYDKKTTHNIISKLEKKGYITKLKQGKEIIVYPVNNPYMQIGLEKVKKELKELVK